MKTKHPQSPLCNGRTFFRATVALASALILAENSAQAVTYTWNQTGATATWNVKANWGGSNFPGSAGTEAVLNGALTANQTITLGQTITVGIIDVGATTAYKYTIGSSAATMNLNNNGSGAQINVLSTSAGDSMAAKVALQDNLTVNNASTNAFTFSSAISGSGSITLSAGGIILSAANTYTGDTIVTSGSLRLTNANALQYSVLVLNGGTVTTNQTSLAFGGLAGSGNFSGAKLTLGNSNTSTGTNTLNPTYSGVISGNITVTKTGTNTQIFTGANVYTGTTTINDGTLQLGDGGSTGSLATTSVILDNGNFAIKRSNNVTQGTDFTATAISGTGSFTQAGTGTTTLGSNNTYTGNTAVTGGELDITGSLASGTVSVSNGAALGGSGIVSGVVTVNGATINGSGLTIASSASFTGTSTLKGTSTATGGYNVTSGTLSVSGTTTSAVNVASGVLKGTGKVGNVSLSGTIAGTLTTGTLSGSGVVSPGNSPGILTIATLADGNTLSFNFELAVATPSYSNATASGNDILHITSSSSGLNLSSENSISIYFSSLSNTSLAGTSTYDGTFFVDGLSASSLLAAFGSAQVTYYVVDLDGNYDGDVVFGGTNYTSINSNLVSYIAKSVTADFGSGSVTGNTLEFTVVPETDTWAMLAGGLGMLIFISRLRFGRMSPPKYR